ncbi:MAG: YceD family protein [Gammaproteobacteria bacterium]
MSQQQLKPLPIRFDPVNFADHNRKLDGLVATRAMTRLMENVLSAEPMAKAKLSISRGLYGYPLVTGQTIATVGMRCERCLDEVSIELKPKIKVLVKPEEENLPENEQIKGEERPEFHEYDGKSLVLSDLIEEELLLTLPLVPKHQDISLCNQDMVAWLAANEAPSEEQVASSERKESPFAILKSVD